MVDAVVMGTAHRIGLERLIASTTIGYRAACWRSGNEHDGTVDLSAS